MRIGVPREVKNNEFRVAITPAGVRELVVHGHDVLVEAGRRRRVLHPRRGLHRRGRRIAPDADETWGGADLVLKVKEPIAEEYHRLRDDLTLFTYLHLAADRALTDALIDVRRHRHRLRDRGRPRPGAAAARTDVRGRGADGAAGRCGVAGA